MTVCSISKRMISIKLANTLLTIAGIKPYATEKIQIDDAGISVIEWDQKYHYPNNCDGVGPCGWVSCKEV